jgi:hypothetical protein
LGGVAGYHNPELHAHMALQKQSEEERRQQQNMVRQSYGQQRFLDLHKFAGFRKDKTDRGSDRDSHAVMHQTQCSKALLVDDHGGLCPPKYW